MSALDGMATQLEQLGTVRRNAPMSRRTTFGIGGPADVLVTVSDADAFAGALRIARDLDQPSFVLGSGSNILVADAGIRGLVIDNRARRQVPGREANSLSIEAGASFAGFARKACREGLSGLAWAVGIPGTLGGAVVYNAGAYGGCLADVLIRARLIDGSGQERWHEADELGLMYRGSALSGETVTEGAVLEVEIALEPGSPKELLDEAAAYDQRRLSAQPRGRNAGSMFKNPEASPAWQLIDKVGMRGVTAGDAAISDKHCNFFVNYGQARAADVAYLVQEAERRVLNEFGVQLVREVSFVGDWT